jgi:hypothetical protein
MFTQIDDFKTISDFAREYVHQKGEKKGKPGVSRAFIYQLIEKEKNYPGTTGLDVLCVGTTGYYVRHTKKTDKKAG